MDAMTSDRPYRKALPFTCVIEEVTRCSGSQFDPVIARAFLTIPRERWEAIAGRRL
jgi:HD-GYP domain-containing protein (c-di-GMP phosphodiesterase class II)